MTPRRKNIPVNIRLSPEMKKALTLAAEKECRSKTSLLEWLLTQHCEKLGISIKDLVESATPDKDTKAQT